MNYIYLNALNQPFFRDNNHIKSVWADIIFVHSIFHNQEVSHKQIWQFFSIIQSYHASSA